MRAVPLLVLLIGCAETSPKPEIIQDCPAARDAEKALAAKEGRRPVPIIQKGRLVTNLFDPRNRPVLTPDMIAAAQGTPLRALARIFVSDDGTVRQVELIVGSGVRRFDEALLEKIRTWKHLPYVVDCHPVPYVYPLNYVENRVR